MKSLLPALIALAFAPLAWAEPILLKPGLNAEVQLTLPAPLASNRALAERFLSPRTQQRVTQTLSQSGKALAGDTLDLSQERFLVYVPKSAPPPQGYGLLVFVPPWDRAQLPRGWAQVLDQAGMIFVSAGRSGNEQSILDRRDPLALMEAHNLTALFKLDPARTYVGGFSGGSRVALRIALAYPDVFRGALLNAGSDPIGDEIAPLPGKALMAQFQASSAVMMTSGADDEINVGKDKDTAISLKTWCVDRVRTNTLPHAGHEPMGGPELARALQTLDRLVAQPPAPLDRCREAVDRRLQARFEAADRLKQAGDRAGWIKALDAIDRTFGGLAAPESLGDDAGSVNEPSRD